MIGVLLAIDAPYFYAGYDMDNGNIAPIIKYMKGWSLYNIVNYCERKGWAISFL